MNTNINSGGDGGNSGIAFIVGGLVVVVALIGFVVAGGYWPFERSGGDVSVRIEQPAQPAPAPEPAPAPGGSSGTEPSGTTSGAGNSTTTTTTN